MAFVTVRASLTIEASGFLRAALPPILFSMMGVTTAYFKRSSYSSFKDEDTELPGLSEGISGVEFRELVVVEAILDFWRL